MDFRNKYLVGTVRTVFGLGMFASGVMGFLTMASMEGVPPELLPMMQALLASGILYLTKGAETVAGLMLVLNFRPALATIFLAPIALGIFTINALLTPAFLPLASIVVLFTAYLGYVYWPKYRALFQK